MASSTNNGVSTIYTITNTSDKSSVVVHSQGAHVTSWRGAAGDERLYLSPKTVYKESKALRGGVPIIYPQFSDLGKGQSHGVARNRQWKLVSSDESKGEASFKLEIPAGDTQFPDSVSAVIFTVTTTDSTLRLGLRVTNKHDQGTPLTFQAAFHSYFRVSNVKNVSLHGFDGHTFLDQAQGRKEVAGGDTVRDVDREIDRLYPKVGEPVSIQDKGAGHTLLISSESLPDIVLWNPWVEKTKKLSADMPEDGYESFVCIEHGAITSEVTLPNKDDEWQGAQIVQLSKL